MLNSLMYKDHKETMMQVRSAYQDKNRNRETIKMYKMEEIKDKLATHLRDKMNEAMRKSKKMDADESLIEAE